VKSLSRGIDVHNNLRIAIIGMGPRGLTVFERICANVAESPTAATVQAFLIDPACVGTGTVWRIDQSSHLLMNTVASQVTVFTDESVVMEGPIVDGPSLYEWASYIVKIGPVAPLTDQVLAEARDITPDTYPTRSLYGHYLRWAFEHVAARFASVVEATEIRGTAIDVCDDRGGYQLVQLSDGRHIDCLDAVVLTQGHLPLVATDHDALTTFSKNPALYYVPPGNAADADLSVIPEREPVIMQGLGLTFFDYVTLLTSGRGGAFVEKNGTIEYLCSGREPIIYAGSRRGVPHHARGENQKGVAGRHTPLVLTQDRIDLLHVRAKQVGDVRFRRDVWPLVAKEVETAYYTQLLADSTSPRELRRFQALFVAAPSGSLVETEILDKFGVDSDQRWDWTHVLDPVRNRRFADPGAFHAWLIDYLDEDVRLARLGNVRGAVKAALDVLRDLRNEVRLVVDHAGITGSSYRDDLDRWYTPMNAFLSIGPPAHRVEEMVALIRAGILHIIGPQMSVAVNTDGDHFVARSPAVAGAQIQSRSFIDARLPKPDIRRTGDNLLRNLLARGEVRPFALPDPDGTYYETGGLEVAESTHALIDRRGEPHPRRFALGVPTESVRWVTAAGPRPGVNSVTLADADRIARAVLAVESAESVGTIGHDDQVSAA
jgi:FAD-NAD(P)-binding